VLALIAVILGLALGQSRFPAWLAALFATAYGLFFTAWQLSKTILESISFRESLISLWGRLLFSANQLVLRENVEDPILFLLMAAIILWIVSLYAGYTLIRHSNAWRASLPLGAIMVVLHTYDALVSRRVWYLAIYIFFTLLLVARVHLLEQRKKWRASNTQMPVYIGSDMLRATLLAAAVLVVLAWVTPTLASSSNPAKSAWDAITAPWRDFRREFGRAFFSLEAAAVSVNDYYGESLALGRGNALATDIVLSAEVPQVEQAPARYYWRDRVYDSYANGGWTVSAESEERIRAEENNLLFREQIGRTASTLQITTGRSIQLIHTPAQPIWISRTADFSYNSLPDGTLDILALQAPVIIRSGESYEVEAYFTTATVTELQEAGSDYPDWVTERYLQVPEEISPRTLELAQELAAGKETPYEVAAAITAWLRENIEYVDSVPIPPSDLEPLDWMLFEQQQAFCNYYATAEIIMLRSLGIPARLAVGYAQGEESTFNLLLDTESEKEDVLEGLVQDSRFFTVRQSDAHAWPEVYFPGIGWVEFEPTGNQANLLRPLGGNNVEADAALAAQVEEQQVAEREAFQEDQAVLAARLAEEQATTAAENQRRLGLLAFVAAAILLVIAFFWRRYRNSGGKAVPVLIERGLQRVDITPPKVLSGWANYSQLEPLPQAYMEINAALRRVGAPPKFGDTPNERATALSAKLPQIAPLVAELSQHYEQAVYNENATELEQARRAKWAIRLASFIEQIRRWSDQLQQAPQKFADWRASRKDV
jgi:transglutaminase-like putative cysteine protease